MENTSTETPKTITFALENLGKVVNGLNETAGFSRLVRDIFDRTDDELQKFQDGKHDDDNPKQLNMLEVINQIAEDIHSKKCFIDDNIMYLKNKLK